MALELQILFDIAIILFFAKIFGEITERLKLSSLVGEVFAGILVGPVFGLVQPNGLLEQIAVLGIIFLLFLIGLSTKFDEVKKNVYVGSALAVFGTGLSVVAGFALGFLWFNSVEVGLVLGLAILSTSTAMTIRSLIDVGQFRTKIYEMSLAIDIADEVIAILALSFLTSWIALGSVNIWSIVLLFFSVIGFFLLILTAGSKIVGKILSVFQKTKDEYMLVSIPLVVAFAVAFFSEHVGIAAVTGAFLAGMAMSKSTFTESHIIPHVKTIGYGLFIPLFFAYSSLIFDIAALFDNYVLIIILVIVGLAAKLVGTGFMSRYFGFDRREQIMIGAGMFPRGEYSIIISQVALAAAVITKQLYTVIIAFVVISIILTPIALRLAGGHHPSQKKFKINQPLKSTIEKRDKIIDGTMV